MGNNYNKMALNINPYARCKDVCECHASTTECQHVFSSQDSRCTKCGVLQRDLATWNASTTDWREEFDEKFSTNRNANIGSPENTPVHILTKSAARALVAFIEKIIASAEERGREEQGQKDKDTYRKAHKIAEERGCAAALAEVAALIRERLNKSHKDYSEFGLQTQEGEISAYISLLASLQDKKVV